ncbi:solute carrier organic anion transporter family member 2B1 isoform X2 [Stegostoma tigrinum]|uniref:solute carrier organic anion transporter family member 2B1 isoform X2 n=1 Tax=Stegostoma tigrinum TaxID=3053191 RepID=UPI00202B0F7F|nr:solute carrier organic anion transporter family member 2B1 isoform X2 [Stegostoma tigrinum]
MGMTGPPTTASKPNHTEKQPRRCAMNPFHSIKFFVLCHGLLQLSQLLVSGYLKSIVSTIEKRFGLSSQTSGMLSSLNEIGSAVFIVFVSYFGSRVHRPRLIGCGGILVSVAAFTMALPHFIMGRYTYDHTTTRILFAVSVLGPAFGFVLGSAVLRLYVDIDKLSAADIDLEFGDPRWVGAWWLGFLMAASFVGIVSVPYFFFPKEMPKEDSRDPEGEVNTDKKLNELKSKQDDVTQGLSLLQFIKSFPCILLRTLRSSVYLLVVLAQVCMSALMSGLTVFIGKFLEQQFTVTASFANLLIGSIHVPGAVLGIILGGTIMRRFQINLRGSAIMCFAAIFASICATAPLLFLGCSTQLVAGINDNVHISNSTSGLELSCNRGCSCKDQVYNPVCTADGIEFVSPCHAGCMSASFETDGKVVSYTNCSCVSAQTLVKPGTCGSGCYELLLPFMIFLTLAGFVATLCQTPSFILVLRSVKPEDKSLAIGIQFMLFRVLAWLPGPILYGSAIDTTCIQWEKKCNKKASCRYYNLDLFRVRYIGLQMLFQCGAFLLFVMAYYFLKKETLRREQQAKMATKAAVDPRVEEERKRLMEQDDGTKLHLESKA